MIVPQTADGLNAGWTALPDGTVYQQVTDFRQSDINEGYIFYQHQSEDTQVTTDTFTFQVWAVKMSDVIAYQSRKVKGFQLL